jgi:5-methylcytosine-specific restriction endonuclease McrA
MKKNKKCLGCNSLIWPDGLRCKSCEGKKRNNKEFLNIIRPLAHDVFRKKVAKHYEKTPCACGCGGYVQPTTKHKNLKYLRGHQNKGKKNPQASIRFSGQNNHSWKGGISDKNKQIRHSPKFKEWRRKVFERDNYTCQMCGERGKNLHPHHIKPFSKYKELRFDINNGQTLCKLCHMKTSTWGVNINYAYKSLCSCL